jgi:hypothetical protein
MDIELSDQYYDFIKNYNESAACDSECQQQKEIQNLKQNYLNALNNLDTAPQQVQSTYQQYLTYTQGNYAYPKYKQRSLEEVVKKMTAEYQNIFNIETSNVQNLLSTYTELYNNYINVYELNNIYIKDNYELQKDIETTNTDTLTNDRKTFYENQATESLQKYYILFSIVYTAIVIYYIKNMITHKYHTPTAIIVLIILIIYPFISLWLSLKIISLYEFMVGLLPKNQYHDL